MVAAWLFAEVDFGHDAGSNIFEYVWDEQWPSLTLKSTGLSSILGVVIIIMILIKCVIFVCTLW
jgi:hypothetical protein